MLVPRGLTRWLRHMPLSPLRMISLAACAAALRQWPNLPPCRGMIAHGNGETDELLDITHERCLLGIAQRDRNPLGSRSRCTAYAVHIGFRHVGKVEIDHVADAIHIDAAGGDIGSDQGAHSPLRKPASARSRWFCDLLPWIACAAMPALARLRTTLSAPCLVRVKTRARSIGSRLNMSTSILRLGRPVHPDDALFDLSDGRARPALRMPSPGRAAWHAQALRCRAAL